MDFKDILVHIDNSHQCGARLELAVRLARDLKAHLTGLYVVTHAHYAPHGDVLAQQLLQARELFQSIVGGAGIDSEYLCADWAVTGDSMVEILNYYSHQKDLIIVGQTAPDRKHENVPADLPERVVLGSGRPVLVVPYSGIFNSVGERVVVAWRSGRASARAVHDAMPFLLKAREVFVVTVNAPDDHHLAEGDRDYDIRTHLERHNIRIREETLETGDVPVDKVLMNYAWEHGCDLLVMGVYAQTLRGTLTIGPVAKLFFEQMTLPVLMSN